MKVTVRELLEAGVHFGHQTNRWNPKMKPYIFEARNGIHVIDLRQTMTKLQQAYDFLKDITARGQRVLFVGTKKQAREIIKETATKTQMYYINDRWLGGILTNFSTISRRVAYYRKVEGMFADGTVERMISKEASKLRREWTKLNKNIGGIKDMDALPGAVFVTDPTSDAIAVHEARKTGIPVIAIADTNCNPDVLDYAIPGNDDAMRTVKLILDVLAEAIEEGKKHVIVVKAPEAVPPAPQTGAQKPASKDAKRDTRGGQGPRRPKSAATNGKKPADKIASAASGRESK